MKKALFISIIFQIVVLLGLLVYAYAPVYFGQEIRIKANGYDPRDIFLGNYTALSYPLARIKTKERYERNRVVYLTLEKDGSIYKASSLSYDKPDERLYLKGRVKYSYKKKKDSHFTTALRFGIEKYFTTTKNAKNMEKKLTYKNATVTLGVLFGIPRIKKIYIDD